MEAELSEYTSISSILEGKSFILNVVIDPVSLDTTPDVIVEVVMGSSNSTEIRYGVMVVAESIFGNIPSMAERLCFTIV